ncbi:Nn.00g073640.m01.CDS01 [Neocucurbitaria sp. VM-36]
MAFSFGFSGDDIEEDPNDVVPETQEANASGTNNPPPIAARTHDLDELLSTLPDKISYSNITITSPKGFTVRLPRRELFDVRLQLMAEDDGSSSNPLEGLNDSDLRPNLYEGGYKTWECSIDLVKYLLDRGPRKDLDDLVRVNHVIEMGCGSALPSLLLFQYALKNNLPMYFTLTDYNADVLRLVTLPNLILTWCATLDEEQSKELFPEIGNPLLQNIEENDNGDLYLTPALLASFKNTLSTTGLTLTLISGSWLPVSTLLSLIPSTPDLNTFILGSETIYSPASLTAFTEAMTELMKRVKSGKTIVAAKRVYFGVGGSVDGFREECARRGCVAYEMEFEGLESDGVRRCLVEVQMY